MLDGEEEEIRRRKKRRRKKKKEDEQNQIFQVGFSRLLLRLAELRVHLATEYQTDVVCKLFSPLCFVYHGAAPIPYVQAAHFEPAPSLTKKYNLTSRLGLSQEQNGCLV